MKGWIDLKRFLLNGSLTGRTLLLGLDFDGTLSPLVRQPALARLPRLTRRLLSILKRGKNVRIAIISGRSRSDIMHRVGIPGIYYSGNHGLTIRGPGIVWRHPKAEAASKIVQNMARELAPALRVFLGTRLENKGLTLTIHYRGIKHEHAAGLGDFLKRTVRDRRRDLMLASGKKTWEIRPRLKWNKGHALSKIAQFAAPGARMVFVGDDRTDEDGFRTLGRRAVTIRVGPARKSAAQFYLARQKQVRTFLEILCGILLDRPCRSPGRPRPSG